MSISVSTNRAYFTWGPPVSFPHTIVVNFGLNYDASSDNPIVSFVDNDVSTKMDIGLHYDIQNIETDRFELLFYEQAGIDFDTAGVLYVTRNTPRTQLVDFIEGDRFPVDSLEKSLDKITMMSQDVGSSTDLSIKVPAFDMVDNVLQPVSLDLLPDSSQRKEKYLYFNEDGQPTAVTNLIPTAIVTPFTEEFLTKETDVECRDLLESAYLYGNDSINFEADYPSLDSHVATKYYVDFSLQNIDIQFLTSNLIDNGQMDIYQLEDYYNDTIDRVTTIDRWKLKYFIPGFYNDQVIERDTDVPIGFNLKSPKYSLLWKNTFHRTGETLDKFSGFYQEIDGVTASKIRNDICDVGFWIKCNKSISGSETLSVSITNGSDESYIHSFQVPSINTWTYITFSIDFTGHDAASYNEGDIGWYFVISADIDTGSVAGSDGWNNSEVYGKLDQKHLCESNDSKLYVTNVTMILGDNILKANGSVYPVTSVSDEYNRCARYMYVWKLGGFGYSTDLQVSPFDQRRIWVIDTKFPTQMCKVPEFSYFIDPLSTPNIYYRRIDKLENSINTNYIVPDQTDSLITDKSGSFKIGAGDSNKLWMIFVDSPFNVYGKFVFECNLS